jgi:putative Mg2+ transporter-C (MgtC) family protein
MPLIIDWPEITLRLGLTVLAGSLLGINRSERGMTAGLRTTLLVCLAASVSMLQTNLLLDTKGRPQDSFVMLDLMRLPLGILTGMGFIGAGAIVRERGQVGGITTAATLWLATVLGLCFGGGQNGLGLVSLGIGMVVLWALKHLESAIPGETRGTLSLTVKDGGPGDDEIRVLLPGFSIVSWGVTYKRKGKAVRRQVRCQVRWTPKPNDPPVPEFVDRLGHRDGVALVRWRTG